MPEIMLSSPDKTVSSEVVGTFVWAEREAAGDDNVAARGHYQAAIRQLDSGTERERNAWALPARSHIAGRSAVALARTVDDPEHPRLNDERLNQACAELLVARDSLTFVMNCARQQGRHSRWTVTERRMMHTWRGEIERDWALIALNRVLRSGGPNDRANAQTMANIQRALYDANEDMRFGTSAVGLAYSIADIMRFDAIRGRRAPSTHSLNAQDRHARRWAFWHDRSDAHRATMQEVLRGARVESSSYAQAVASATREATPKPRATLRAIPA